MHKETVFPKASKLYLFLFSIWWALKKKIIWWQFPISHSIVPPHPFKSVWKSQNFTMKFKKILSHTFEGGHPPSSTNLSYTTDTILSGLG